uniref:Uncharacterized protein n=2 Tax=environmental samples TaxID=48479 RepID=A0A806JZY9_9BACT|nr:hypothetical protein [uncultured bacterium contig00193]AGS53730.1 hypothetical protein [uncultured bacterium contig00068]
MLFCGVYSAKVTKHAILWSRKQYRSHWTKFGVFLLKFAKFTKYSEFSIYIYILK